MRRLTNEEFLEKAALLNPHLEILGTYINSRTKVLVRCKKCKYTWEIVANSAMNTKCGCPGCANNAKIEPQEFKELADKKGLIIDDPDWYENFSTKKRINVHCSTCTCKFKTTHNTLKFQGSGCPACAGKKVVVGFNDLNTTYPDVAKMLKDKNDGYKYTFGSAKNVYWICPICGSVLYKSIYEVVTHGLCCQNCKEGFSFPERYVMALLDCLHINYEYQKRFKWSDGKRYDFYIKNDDCIIETHGSQHYEGNNYFNRTYKEEHENDIYKKDIALKNNIKNYVILDCRFSEGDWIKNKIINSELSNLYNLENVNWDYINLQSQKRIIYEIIDMCNEGKNVREIACELHISWSSVNKYIQIAQKNQLCKYDPKERRTKPVHHKIYKPVMCVTTNKKFINMKEAADFYNISYKCLIRCLRNGQYFYGKINGSNEKLQWKLLEKKENKNYE